MKISIIGNNLTALVLAKILLKKKIEVDLFYESNRNINFKSVRTIGITRSNVIFLKEYFKNIDKIGHKIDKITISTSRQKNDVLSFGNNREFLFSIFKYSKIYNYVKSNLNKEKNLKLHKIKLDKKLKENSFLKSYDIVFDVNLNNPLSKKLFSNQIKKNYFSRAFVTIINHKKVKNKSARQIFSPIGPLAFLPISDKQTSIVYSIFNKDISKLNNNKIIETIKNYNTKYIINSFSDIKSFELKLSLIRKYFKNNVLAFGDKAHTIHPLAGQGFNMCLRDIKIFLQILNDKLEYGLNLDASILEEYEKKSKYKNFIFANSIDLIHELFNFEKKIPLELSKKLFFNLEKNNLLKKYISKIADRGINF